MMTKVSSEKISDYEKYQLDVASFIFFPLYLKYADISGSNSVSEYSKIKL